MKTRIITSDSGREIRMFRKDSMFYIECSFNIGEQQTFYDEILACIESSSIEPKEQNNKDYPFVIIIKLDKERAFPIAESVDAIFCDTVK